MRVTLGHKGRYHFSETAQTENRELLLSLFGGLAPANHAARVGVVARDLATRIGGKTEVVQVSVVTILKIKGKHTRILYSDLELLQHGFNQGRVQQDGPRHLIFLFRDPRNHSRTLKAVVKAAHHGAELILSSYYMCTGKRLTAALKKGALIRDW